LLVYTHTIVHFLLAHFTFFRAYIVTTNNIAELVVGFENTSLEVSENAGNVELCLNVSQPSYAPIDIEFNLTVESRAGTAG